MDEIPPVLLRILRFLLERRMLFQLLEPYEWWLRRKYPNPALPQFSYQVTIHTIRNLYGRRGKIAWASLFFPSEFFHAARLIPFYPEIAIGLVAALRFVQTPLAAAEKAWFSQDLCSYHRGGIGMSLLRLFPRPDFLFATSSICHGTVGFFEVLREIWNVPLFLVDVPKQWTRDAEGYVAEQLTAIARHLEREWRVHFVWDKPFFFSNRTREILLEVEALRQRKDRMLLPPTKNLDYLPYYYEFLGEETSLRFAERLKEELSKPSKTLPHRLIWLHLKPFYSGELPALLEKLGLGVVYEEFTTPFPEELSPSSPLKSLARKILWASEILATSRGRIPGILEALKRYDAEGVIQFTQWGCRQSQGMVMLLREKLLEAGYPVLFLDGDHLDRRHSAPEQLRTRLEAFLEMLEGRGSS